MSELWLAALRSQFQEIEGRLAGAGQPAEREALKRDIIALFKRVDSSLTDLNQMKEDIRGLVERFKQAGAAADTAPAPPSRKSTLGRVLRTPVQEMEPIELALSREHATLEHLPHSRNHRRALFWIDSRSRLEESRMPLAHGHPGDGRRSVSTGSVDKS